MIMGYLIALPTPTLTTIPCVILLTILNVPYSPISQMKKPMVRTVKEFLLLSLISF